MRSVRDKIMKRAFVDFGDMHLKMILAVAGYCSINSETVRMEFRNVGLWPMDYRFIEIAQAHSRSPNVNDVQTSTPTQDLRERIAGIITSRRSVQDKASSIIHLLLNKNDVVLESFQSERDDIRGSLEGNGGVLDRGQGAVYLSHKEVKEKRKS